MKVSELIVQLQKGLELNGDARVQFRIEIKPTDKKVATVFRDYEFTIQYYKGEMLFDLGRSDVEFANEYVRIIDDRE